ncbi:MAG: methyltransferase domain-containing protein [Solirubrobacteraceae bacterium]|nr:methyltransferase domain-containing protein [Solirubrobacteraceae bacterium]
MNGAPDWGIGAYEAFASTLEAPAEHLVRIAAPHAGERAIDLGCGSGNATMPLAAAGAQVTAIDPSLRLLGIATERARQAGHRITSAVARAESLPLPDGDADLVISNFGVIFANDPPAAFAEVLRVLARGGRFVFTAWKPTGPIADVSRLMRAATIGDSGPLQHVEPAVVAWHDPETFEHLVPGGLGVIVVHESAADFTAESAEAWVQQQAETHPLWLSAREHIADDAIWARVMTDSVEALAPGTQPDGGFVVSSPYVVIEIHPKG